MRQLLTIRSIFQWYHREEWQVVAILIGLILFFARTIWISIGVSIAVLAVMLFLYTIRLLEIYCNNHGVSIGLIEQYKILKSALHKHSVERSRIAMALLASCVLLVLTLHRIDLALTNPFYATPSDVYWIFFLGWYTLLCTVSCSYLLWLWRNWVRKHTVQIPFLDGLVASMFFFHGLKTRERIITYIAAFFLGGLPSYFAVGLSTNIPYAYSIAMLLIIPVMLFTLGGAYYAMHYLKKANAAENRSV